MDKVEIFYEHALHEAMEALERGWDPQEVAGAYMAIAMRLYKSTMNEEDFNKMRDIIKDSDIPPYEKKKLH